MKTKKMVSWLLGFVAFLFVFSMNVNAESYKAGGECGRDLKWSLDYNGNLFIYGEGAMTNFGVWDHETEGWYDYRDEIRTVVIEDGATSIGRAAFSGYKNLKTVKLPSTLKIIESDVFDGCTALSDIKLPKGLTQIGSHAFYKCISLTQLVIPDTVTNLGDMGWGLSTFDGSGLVSVAIPASVNKMAGYCFVNCPNLTSVTINGNNLEIPYQAFANCKKLTTVKIGSGVTGMWSSAFWGCSSLRNLTLGKNLKFIKDSAFKYCTSLRTVTIPDKVTSMDDYVFEGCTSLETATVGLSMTEFGSDEFRDCSSLKTVKFCGEAPKFDGNENFAGCGNLTVYYPGSSKTWDRSNMTSHGAVRVDWKSWTPTIDHYTPVMKSVAASSKGVAVTWNQLKGAAGYEVWRSVGNGKFEKVKTITSGSTTGWTDTKVTNGKRYSYRIYGTNGKIVSNISGTKYLYYLAQNTEALSKYGSGIKVKWRSNTAATGYVIEYSTRSSFSAVKKYIVTGYKSTGKIIYPRSGLKYYVRVRTYKKVDGKTFYSAWSSAKAISI